MNVNAHEQLYFIDHVVYVPVSAQTRCCHRAGPARVNIMLAAMIEQRGPRFAACGLASFPDRVLSLLPRGLGTRLLVGVQLCSDLPISSTPSLSDLIHLFSVPLSHFIYSLVEI